jgi:DNA gyrase subunit B
VRIEGDRLSQLANLLLAIEEPLRALERRGLGLGALVERRTPNGLLPVFHVSCGAEEHWFATKDQTDAFLKSYQEQRGEEVEVIDEAQPASNGSQKDVLHVSELHEVRQLNKLLPELPQYQLDIEMLLPAPQADGVEHPPTLLLYHGDEVTPLVDLRAVLPTVRKLGEKGLSITRFKGLGEMDPEELWETTMDPARRTLLQVRLEDAHKADEMFRILMGDQVEPRREFIETHALEVRNLDV